MHCSPQDLSFLEGCPHFTMVPEWAVLPERDIHPSPSTLRAHSIYTNNWEFLGGLVAP